MSSQKPGKTKQKSLLCWVKPQDTKARVEDENVEETRAAEIPEGSSESGQDHAAVESVEAVGSQLPLLGDRPNQPRNLSFPSRSYGNRNRSFQSGWFDRHPWLHYTPNANMADHSVGARDESHESEVSQALMFCFDNAFPEKSCFVVDLVPLFRPLYPFLCS